MAKLKNVVKQLSEKDFNLIYDSLIGSGADKSAFLLKALRVRQLSESKIIDELGVNSNAYYTLRSRLNQKIEEHLVEQMESPRTDILKKVANINEVIFTKKRTISIATLKKMEKELIDYDLANELTAIYKSLKKLHVNSPEHFQYSQAYNRHVAYMLAVDKAEDILAEYFKICGHYMMTGEESQKLNLMLLMREMGNVSNLYESHRLYVFLSCIRVSHKLFIEKEEEGQDSESIQDTFTKVDKIFATYKNDPLYYHLNLVFEFLKLEYFTHYRIYIEGEKHFDEVNDAATNLLMNYPYYTFSSRFLVLKLERALRLNSEGELYQENETLFSDYEEDQNDTPRLIMYAVYRSLSSYYVGRYEEAAKILQTLMNDVVLKNFPLMQIEIKGLLALLYCHLKDIELFNQLSNSLQRLIRLSGKNSCENVLLVLKICKVATSEAKREKAEKIRAIIPKVQSGQLNYFSPTGLIKLDEQFIEKISS